MTHLRRTTALGAALAALLLACAPPPTAEDVGAEPADDPQAADAGDEDADDEGADDTDDAVPDDAAATDADADSGAAADALVLARTGDVDNLDPHLSTAFQTVQSLEQVYETLFRTDEDLEVEGALVQEWAYDDAGTTLTLTLHDGVTFHDGSELTSEDVVASLERILDEETGAVARANLTAIEAVEAPDDLTVELQLSAPDGTLPSALTSLNTAIAPAEAVASGDIATEPVGSGPFTFDEWVQGQAFRVTAYADHWEQPPALAGVEMRVVPDESSIVAGLQAGEYDLGVLTDPLVVSDIDEGQLEVLRAPSLSYRVLQLDTTVEPLDDPQVRQAMACAIDRQEVIDAALVGEGEITGPFTSPAYDYDPYLGLPCDGPDPELAQELLDSAGHADGFSLEAIVMTGGYATAVTEAQSLQSQLGAIGVDLELEQLETNVYVERWSATEYDVAIALNGGSPDPHIMYNRYFTADGNLQSVATYSSPELDELFAEGAAETDEAARLGIYEQVAEDLGAASPWIWYAQGFEYRVTQPEVSGFVNLPSGSLRTLRDTTLGG